MSTFARVRSLQPYGRTDLAGIVVEVQPKRTASTGAVFVNFTIKDQDDDNISGRIFFNKGAEPPVMKPGDVVILRQALLTQYNNNIIFSQSIPNYIIISPREYLQAPGTYTAVAHDGNRTINTSGSDAVVLTALCNSSVRDPGTVSIKQEYYKPLCALVAQGGGFTDTVGCVIAVTGTCVVLWDGTRCRDELYVETGFTSIITPCPSYGSFVVMKLLRQDDGTRSMTVGSWYCLRNLVVYHDVSNKMSLGYTIKSSVTLVSSDAPLVSKLNSDYKDLCSRHRVSPLCTEHIMTERVMPALPKVYPGLSSMSPRRLVTVSCASDDDTYVSIADIKTCSTVPSVFHTAGYIVSYSPSTVAEFLVHGDDGRPEFSFALLLQDDTDSVWVHVTGVEACTFLSDYCADDVALSGTTGAALQQTMKLLCGHEVYLECCVTSFTNAGVMCYSMHNTILDSNTLNI